MVCVRTVRQPIPVPSILPSDRRNRPAGQDSNEGRNEGAKRKGEVYLRS